jgi:hypothetical protein
MTKCPKSNSDRSGDFLIPRPATGSETDCAVKRYDRVSSNSTVYTKNLTDYFCFYCFLLLLRVRKVMLAV